MVHVKRLLTIVVAGTGLALFGPGCTTTEDHKPHDEHPSAPSDEHPTAPPSDEHPRSEHPN